MSSPNIFFLVVDAFCYDNLTRKINGEHTTPFLNELCEKSLSFTNFYSTAPYTEASLVSILSGENTLENGGYLMGNKNIKKTVFETFRNNGYKVISQFSPYVYSKAYLKDVDYWFYTRLFSISPLFNYRFDYYKQRFDGDVITTEEISICKVLLSEAFETWIRQAKDIIDNNERTKLIANWVDVGNISRCLKKLVSEQKTFASDPLNYLRNLFLNYSSHSLKIINNDYNHRISLPVDIREIKNIYERRFKNLQKKYTSIIKRKAPSFRYLFSTLFNDCNGLRTCKRLLGMHRLYYKNTFIGEYLNTIDQELKIESCMNNQFEYVVNKAKEINKQGSPSLCYLHVQDFHLPSVIHSVDSSNKSLIFNEINDALSFGEKIDEKYQGNLLADLSAFYCDQKIKSFFNTLTKEFDKDFVLVITADHGYPSYFNPPRPIIYNQTYKEAFHIPYILFKPGIEPKKNNGFYDSRSFFKLLENGVYLKPNEYVLTEYAGPGCPVISQKKVWYTYIDSKYRASFEVDLNDDVNKKSIKAVFNLQKDEKEIKNLRKKRTKEIDKIISVVQTRHLYLQNKFRGNKFYSYICNDEKN